RVHKKYLGGYVAVCEFAINLKRVTPDFISSLVAKHSDMNMSQNFLYIRLVQVVGVDGYSGGWIAAVYDSMQQCFTLRTYARFRELIDDYTDAACIAVDIPIGLAQGEARRPDVKARKVLGPRRSSVFPAPDPRLLSTVVRENLDYDKSSKLSRDLLGKGISKQAFAIFPKIAEVNKDMSPGLQQRIVVSTS
ncbi:MAG: DUF429 domain-containing protein, partial [Actinomycetota bacterium]|nr:DUF429 domain-containing protein [Actinomycetota bacterium]